MSETIDVLITIDAKEIIANLHGNSDPKSPVNAHAYVHMDVQQSDAESGQGTAELTVSATVGDTIRWRETTLSLNFEYTGILYEFHPWEGSELITKPAPLILTQQEPLPKPGDPLNPDKQTVKNYVWQSTAQESGKVTYTFNFMIIDKHFNKIGYYSWDPYIDIKD